MGSLTGQVCLEDGTPLPGGIISFFEMSKGLPPLVANMHRIPDVVATMGPEGRFKVKLVPGSYYMRAIVTDPKRGLGPPREGETFYFAKSDAGNLRIFTIAEKDVMDAGSVIGGTPESFPESKDLATIEGRILSESGQPYEGANATLKIDKRRQRPDYISSKTEKDGKFLLRVPPGQYYLQCRATIAIVASEPSMFEQPDTFGFPKAADSLLIESKPIIVNLAKGEVLANLQITLHRPE
ncbi:MAG: carboxypeptidase-like regulatory domain-containing protein [Desulfobulbaceae bacterium]